MNGDLEKVDMTKLQIMAAAFLKKPLQLNSLEKLRQIKLKFYKLKPKHDSNNKKWIKIPRWKSMEINLDTQSDVVNFSIALSVSPLHLNLFYIYVSEYVEPYNFRLK